MYFRRNDIELYYKKCGSGSPLILLHGNGESNEIFSKAVPLLEKHFTVYAVDSRGHGRSTKTEELHYADMADDIYAMITGLRLESPVVYGFSDGGIIALLLATKYPDLLSQVIGSGVNTRPDGIRSGWMMLFRLIYLFTGSPEFRLMLTEPDITSQMLGEIRVPVTLTGGSRDMIKTSHMKSIAAAIPGAVFRLLEGESHSSYVVDSEKIAHIIIEAVEERRGENRE